MVPRLTSLPAFTFTGTTAFITGGGSGIGRAVAHAVAGQGSNVMVTDIDAERSRTVADEITGQGGKAIALPCDVTSKADLTEARDRCLSEFGRIDLVFNNVGVMVCGRPEVIGESEWTRILDINVVSVVRSNEVFLPLLIEQKSGHVVNTSSASALLNYAYDRTPYAASKAAVLMLSESLYLYLRPFGVGVTCLCPAGVITNILEHVRVLGDPLPLRQPDHAIVTPDVVADRVVDAIRGRRFLAVSVDSVLDELRRKGADLDAYLEERELWINAPEDK